MLDDFIVTNCDAIMAEARSRASSRKTPRPTDAELVDGIPAFLDQLGETLRRARSNDAPDHEELGKSAGRHGGALFRMGLSVGHVVHDYGDICQAITTLAISMKQPLVGDDLRLVTLCMDDAIAAAVTEWTTLREQAIRGEATEILGTLAHELRNLLHSSVLAYDSIKKGRVGVAGSISTLLSRNLLGLGSLIDRSLADVRMAAGVDQVEQISVAGFLREIETSASLQADAREVYLVVSSAHSAVTIEGDRQVLAAAIANLLQNGFKFSHRGATIALTTRVTEDRVLFDVEDQCGGLPPGAIEQFFVPFSQLGKDRTGLGLGLSICLKAAEASGGEMSVRDLPGKGCVFTMALPRKRPPPPSIVVKNEDDVGGNSDESERSEREDSTSNLRAGTAFTSGHRAHIDRSP